MEQIKISAKNLGAVALADYCERCFWIKLKTSNKLPWQIFPGIFSSIDSYTKKCVHGIIDDPSGSPAWMNEMGDICSYEKVPHWSKSKYLHEKTNIMLVGGADDILVRRDGGRVIPDYKTSKFTDNQDKLIPMYKIQLVSYSIILYPKASLFLIYFEPLTSDEDAADGKCVSGFNMAFSARVIPIQNDRVIVEDALSVVRDIYEKHHAPAAKEGCKDCEALDSIIGLLA